MSYLSTFNFAGAFTATPVLLPAASQEFALSPDDVADLQDDMVHGDFVPLVKLTAWDRGFVMRVGIHCVIGDRTKLRVYTASNGMGVPLLQLQDALQRSPFVAAMNVVDPVEKSLPLRVALKLLRTGIDEIRAIARHAIDGRNRAELVLLSDRCSEASAVLAAWANREAALKILMAGEMGVVEQAAVRARVDEQQVRRLALAAFPFFPSPEP